MSKGETLTGIERGRIAELNNLIASEIGRSKIVIANFLKYPDAYGRLKRI